MSRSFDKYKDIFNEGNESFLILESKRLLSIRERLKQESVLDANKTPTPNLLSQESGIPTDTVIELLDFCDTGMLSDLELSIIHERATGFVDIDGNPTRPIFFPNQSPYSEEY